MSKKRRVATTLLLLAAALQLACALRGFTVFAANAVAGSALKLQASSSNEGFSRGSTFASQTDYLTYLQSISSLPEGFSVGNARFSFKPFEVDKTLPMNLTLILTDKVSE